MATFSNGTTTTSYKYNEDGVRTSKTVGTEKTEFFVDGTTILAQKTGNVVNSFYYDANGKRIAFRHGGIIYYYVYNLQGDVTHILNESGNIVGTYEYDAWGKITNLDELTAVAKVNPFRYRGYYYDTESGLYYLNSRYYNPEWGRFINADSYVTTGQGLTSYNMFVYCGNNPIINIDPDGTCPYNGTAADFHRLEQGLPSLDCTCTEYEYFAYSEHKKKGTTNPANKENHQNAEARRKRDKRGEKGDARRKDYSNKRKNNINIEINTEVITTVCYGAVAIGGSAAIIYIVVNNVTGVGIMDDVAIAPITKVVWDSASKAFA